MRISSSGSVISALVDTVSKNGNLLLNLSPMSDGTIPEEQQKTLLGVGQWLDMNGEAIYGTHNWVKFSDGQPRGGLNVHFTVKGDVLYAIIVGKWPAGSATINSLGSDQGKISKVSMLGVANPLTFEQSGSGLKVNLPASALATMPTC